MKSDGDTNRNIGERDKRECRRGMLSYGIRGSL